MRPRYEGKEDRADQDAVKVKLENAWRCQLIDTPPMHSFDFVVVENSYVRGFVEFKRRRGRFGIYPDTMLSIHKLYGINAVFPIPVFFVVQWDDKVVWCELKPDLWSRPVYGGRTAQTRDSGDIEVVAHIPNELFSEVG